MAESLAILSIAGNVFQVADVGTRILVAGWKAASTTWGTLPRNTEMEKDAGTLKELLGHLRDNSLPSNLHSGRPASLLERCLNETVSGCQKTAEELLSMLEGFHIHGDHHRKRKSIWNAFRSEWKRSVIDEKKARLDEYKRNISLILLQVLKDGNSVISTDIRNLTNELHSMGVQFKYGMESLNMAPLKIIERLELLISSKYGAGFQGARNGLTYNNSIAISKSAPSNSPPKTDELVKLLDSLILRRNEVYRISKILSSLSFDLIDARRSEIRAAEFDTFRWIFAADSSPFLNWLRSSSGVFWIAGKAGSGKSTLMRYLGEHIQTKRALEDWALTRYLSEHGLTNDDVPEWANPDRVVIATYFFWNGGTKLQTSQEGLLRTLLFEIFSQIPSLVEKVCPHRWHNFPLDTLSNNQWTRIELLETFQGILKAKDLRVKFCLFIDGLDEYVGDHGELVEFLKAIPSTSNIKFCVSSRPWNEFRNAWDNDLTRCFYLEDLTQNDVRVYVTKKLKESVEFREISQESRCSEGIVEEIVEKAHGVFLWVFLVVRSLLRGLGHGDKISDLQARLREFPSELEDYFKHMLASIEERYKRETCQLFQIALSIRQSVPLITYSFLDEEDPKFAENMDDEPLDNSRLSRRLKRTKKRINARCRDLLNINEPPPSVALTQQKVDFLHRTVRDFLGLNDMRQLLFDQTPSSFNLHLLLCRSFLATIKTLPALPVFTWDRFLSHLVENAMTHLQKLDQINFGDEESYLFQCIYKSMKIQADRLHDQYGQWWNHQGQDATLISFAIGYNLCSFIEKDLNLGRDKVEPDNAAILLRDALFGGMQSLEHNPDAQMTSIPVLKLLLGNGISPNVNLDGVPLWELLMCHISANGVEAPEQVRKTYAKTIEILLTHGVIPAYTSQDLIKSKQESVTVIESIWHEFIPECRHLVLLINHAHCAENALESKNPETFAEIPKSKNEPQELKQGMGILGKLWTMVGYG